MKRIVYSFSLVVFVLFSQIQILNAQKTSLHVIDASTKKACSFANLVMYNSDNEYTGGKVTDKNGFASLNINTIAKVKISSVGYISEIITVKPGETLTIELKTDFGDMEEIVVTGQYNPRKTDRSIYKIDVINSKTMRDRGITNLAEALSNETGVRLSIDPSTGTSVELQGMGGENVKYLLDGIPITGRVNGDIDLSQINMENVDHIEIVQGPMSVVYGTNALAGVINIITKQNAENKNIIKVNTYNDSKENYNFGFYGSVNHKKHTITASTNRDMFRGIDIDLNVDTAKFPQGNDRYMEFKPKRVFNAGLEYSYRDKYFSIRAKSQYMNMLLKSYNNPTPLLISYDADYYTTRSINSFSVRNKITDALSYNVVGAYTYYGRNTDYINSDLVALQKEVTGSSATTFHNAMTRGSFTRAKENSKLSFQFGWDINYDTGEGDKIADTAQITDAAGFLSAQYRPFEQLSIQPGFRYIYNSIYPTPLIPSINLQWKLFDAVNFRVSYAKGFRAPSLKELYLDFKDSNHNLEGNKDLKAEKTDSYNASISYKYGFGKHLFKIEPSAFYNNGKDAITLIVTDIESNSATNTNLGARRTLGGSINGKYLNFSGLMLGAGFGITGESYDYYGENDYTPIVYYNNYSFLSKYKWRKAQTIFSLNVKYYGITPSLSVDSDTEEYYRVHTEPYADIEATISKQLWKERIMLIAGGKNLADNYSNRTYGYRGEREDYYAPVNYGRTFFIKMIIKLEN